MLGGKIAKCNIDMTVAILACGGNLSLLVEFCSVLGLKHPSYRSLSRYASAYVYPAIRDLYAKKNKQILEDARKKEKLVVASK